jgi:hypothetical protein
LAVDAFAFGAIGELLHEREAIEISAELVFLVVGRVLGGFGLGGVGGFPILRHFRVAAGLIGFASFACVGCGRLGRCCVGGRG